MITILYKRRRFTALFLLTLMVIEMVTPTVTYALTSGPVQPETQAFQPAGTTDMVDLFSGDFSYNIPLFELPGPNGGYPFNLSYQSGIGMDQESTWVGLGFSLNPGAINRQMRGLPDEFKGDEIYTKTSIAPSVTVGLGVGVNVELFGGDNISAGVGFSVNQNSYKGVGYSIDGSLGLQRAVGSSMTAGLGLNVSLGSKEGISANASLSLDGKLGGLGLGAGYNSKTGLNSISLTHDIGKASAGTYKDGKSHTWSSLSNTTVLSLAHPGYTPQVSMPMRNVNLSAKFKAGGSWWGVFGSAYVTGFYNEQWLKNNKKRVKSNAYGYMNYQHSGNTADVLDLNREKDGMVTKQSPNLSIPSLTYDIYNVSGQGISAMYRPMRNDYGIVRDPETTSTSVGGSVGVDVGPATSHVGVNLSMNYAKSTSGTWGRNDKNNMTDSAGFLAKNKGSEFEPWYFKVHGEVVGERESEINALGGTDAVRVNLEGDNINPYATSSIEKNKTWGQAMHRPLKERKARNQVIQPITNEELLDSKNEELISLFKVKYIDVANEKPDEQLYDRSNKTANPPHHIAGLTALTPEGLRYNYGIPAYNLYQEEVTFTAQKLGGQVDKVSVGNNGLADPVYEHKYTEQFLKRVEMPPYAHSYLLTSIVGPDYVDVKRDGITIDDLGYWVKFTYKKTSGFNMDKTKEDPKRDNAYRWRDPFSGAHFQEGWKTDPRDDKGSFTFGKKEMWYLTKAETKSHICTFSISQREDGRGVKYKLQDKNELGVNEGSKTYKLDEIKLFARSSQTFPIKVVKFDYDYSLCPGIVNSGTNKGKLTLKRLWFEYGKSTKGSLNPYKFGYDETNNPAYDQLAYDRWGNYKPYPKDIQNPSNTKFDQNRDFPYVDQNLPQETMDKYAAAWSLREVQLPSGGKILVDYEADDYGYVQHLPAMQMVALVDPYKDVNQASTSTVYTQLNTDTRIRFALASPIKGTLSALEQKKEVLKYLDQARKQLYFKIKVNLRGVGENFQEFISGYADIDFAANMALERDASGDYVYGTFYLVKEDAKLDKDNNKAHPFAMRAWQHLRTNQPELANSTRKLNQTEDKNERVKQIRSLGGIASHVKQMFGGFYKFCNKEGWGKEITVGKSWVRLNSPEKKKYGGGLRVRQITMKDNWKDGQQEDEEGFYGQVYEYTIVEDNDTISSGVAAYEPIVGGDENPLRYAKKYTEAVPLRSDNNMFFEYPINESYFPGPQVGYRKVTVTSLPAASLAGKIVKHATFPKGTGVSYGTTGLTEHEFYTAKDFPVITDETEKVNKPYKLSVPIPFLGSIAVSKLTTSQGYSILTNDMHGKVKQVSNYRQDETGKIDTAAISWVKYNYVNKLRMYQQQKVSEVSARFQDNGDGTLGLLDPSSTVTGYTLGQENEFFFDMRQFEDKTWGGGVNINADMVVLLFCVIPVPTLWPNISKNTQQLRTAVANKVVYKTGILESVEAYDGGSRVITKNEKWDKQTGAVVLSKVSNNFDKDIYSYNIPAYTQYQGMGAAFKNIGLTFDIDQVKKTAYKPNLYEFSTPKLLKDLLFPGDEILLYAKGESITTPLAKVIFNGEESDVKILHSEVPLEATEYQGMIIRSGYRNQLSVSAGNITALKNPLDKGIVKEYSKSVSVPKVKSGN